MIASLTWRGREPAGWRWIASITAQRSDREPVRHMAADHLQAGYLKPPPGCL
jgi:hypothetical protein